MRSCKLAIFSGLLAVQAFGQGAMSLEDAARRITATENRVLEELSRYRPLVETYVQFMKEVPDAAEEVGADAYFIGNFDLQRGVDFQPFNAEKTFGLRPFQIFRKNDKLKLIPRGFAQMAVLDAANFSPEHYEFANPHGEFLGEVRCLVLDVKPKAGEPPGRFVGRIWAEDRDFHIVRFSGTYTVKPSVRYFHFNSYRQQMGPGLWLPSVTYVEESFSKNPRHSHVDLKAHVRFWSYASTLQRKTGTFTNILVEAPEAPQDRSDGEMSRTEALRDWERQAEENTIHRMEKAGLLGPEGEVEKVLDTVLNNLLVTNKAVVEPPLRTRVLLSTPLESCTVGRTVMLSRGLIDVLPTEASLAAVIARELAGVLLGYRTSTLNAFSDRMLFDDAEIFRQFGFRRTVNEDLQANRKALELLRNSPYKDQLPAVGLFLAALAQKAAAVANLTKARVGNPIAEEGRLVLVPELLAGAPKLDPQSTTQIAALPLASRVRLDPWLNGTEMIKAKPVALLSPREKMPFEVMPVILSLKRQEQTAAGGGRD